MVDSGTPVVVVLGSGETRYLTAVARTIRSATNNSPNLKEYIREQAVPIVGGQKAKPIKIERDKPSVRLINSSCFLQTRSNPTLGLQLRRAISIQAEGARLLEKHAIAPSAARLCWARF
jgi:hypothetical protein